MLSCLVLYPENPKQLFDVSAVRSQLLTAPAFYEDPGGSSKILVVSNPESRRLRTQQRLEGEDIHPSSGVIVLEPGKVALHFENVEEEDLSLMKSFAQAIMDQYSPRVFSEYKDDEWTDICNGKIDIMFEYDTWAPRDRPE